jgi:hypothetical protein
MRIEDRAIEPAKETPSNIRAVLCMVNPRETD